MKDDTRTHVELRETRADGARPNGVLCSGESVDGRYRVEGFLGSGGMGEVYEVEHIRLRRRLALKALRGELGRDAKLIERFERESRTVASLHSEHVVSILDSGSMPSGAPYFVMELLRGEDLRRLLARCGTLPACRVANIGIDACRGLEVAHTAGLVHRDLKPENLFITRGDDGRDVCKLLDFGVAKLLNDNTTTPGSLIGTARYMAPEQAGTDAPLGPHTDVYSLGVILYECLAGRVPFEAETLERLLFKVMHDEFEPLERARPDLPRALTRAVGRALAKDPSARYPSARAFAEALLAVSGGNRSWAVAVARGAERATPADAAQVASVTVSLETTSGERHEGPLRSRARFAASNRGLLAALAITALAAGALLARPRMQARATPAIVAGAASSQPDGRAAAPDPATDTVGPALVPVGASGPEPTSRVVDVGVTPSGVARAQTRRLDSSAPRRTGGSRRSDDATQPPVVSFDPQNPYGREDGAAR